MSVKDVNKKKIGYETRLMVTRPTRPMRTRLTMMKAMRMTRMRMTRQLKETAMGLSIPRKFSPKQLLSVLYVIFTLEIRKK